MDANLREYYAVVPLAAFPGLADWLKVMALQLSAFNDVMLTTSTELLLMTLFGGLATTLWPVAGHTMIVILQNCLAALDGIDTIIL